VLRRAGDSIDADLDAAKRYPPDARRIRTADTE
jgi:hypothetical protein